MVVEGMEDVDKKARRPPQKKITPLFLPLFSLPCGKGAGHTGRMPQDRRGEGEGQVGMMRANPPYALGL